MRARAAGPCLVGSAAGSATHVLMVVGEKDFQTMVSQMLVAMKREMPEPRP